MSDEKPEQPKCIVCRRTELADDQAQTCIGCLNRVRVDLGRIVDGYAILPRYLHTFSTRSPGTGEGGSRNADTPVTGGDTLVLIAGGSRGASQLTGQPYWHTCTRWCQKVDNDGHRVWDNDSQPVKDCVGEGRHWRYPEHRADEIDGDTPSILYELERWEAEWRQARHVQAAPTKATLTNITGYLHANLAWAAQEHPDFDDFADDIHRLRGHVDRALGVLDRPVIANAPCIDCGERLARRWTVSGLEDDWTCLGCRRVYTEADYYLAIEQHQTDAQKRKEHA